MNCPVPEFFREDDHIAAVSAWYHFAFLLLAGVELGVAGRHYWNNMVAYTESL